MTQKPGIKAHDDERGGSYFGVDYKTRLRSCGVFPLLLGCLSIGLFGLRAAPVTRAYAESEAQPSFATNAQSGPAQVSSSQFQDYVNNSQIWGGRSQAQTSFGFNSAYATYGFDYATSPGGLSPRTPRFIGTASYVLSWSTLDHSSSGNILSRSLSLSNNSSISGLQLGSFQFQYGTPYTIQSSLSVYTTYSSGMGHTLANSVWSDTFTIHGQPDGSSGMAGFDVNLNGSIFTTSTNGPPLFGWPQYPGNYTDVTADFSHGASLDYVFLPDGATLATDSGFPAIVTPEPSVAGLLLLAGCGFCLRRRGR